MLGLFITNINYTPQGILIKPNKKDRLINDSSFQLTQISIPYNAFTNKKDEPPCTFGPAFITLLIDIYNLRISFPNHELWLGFDDITGAFRLLKFAPEAVSGEAIQVGNNLHFAVAQTFGDTTSPPNWDPFSRATCQIASNLLNMNVDLPTHQTYMNKVKVSPDPEYNPSLSQKQPKTNSTLENLLTKTQFPHQTLPCMSTTKSMQQHPLITYSGLPEHLSQQTIWYLVFRITPWNLMPQTWINSTKQRFPTAETSWEKLLTQGQCQWVYPLTKGLQYTQL